MKNSNLQNAKAAKNDEFYTQYADIQNEINAYIDYNADVFRNKTILLPCDDPEWSNFTKFFINNFERYGIKKLRDEADVIITNPPFSLFREFVAYIFEGRKSFAIIGNMNAITYKEIFPLIKENKMWLGNGFSAGNAFFGLPEKARKDYASGVFNEATGLVKFRNVCWFTNIEHGKRHTPLPLMTMADNIKHSKHKEIKNLNYLKYDNCDAIEVPFTDAIPSDYDGIMGVPISFLDKYCPEQFEILGLSRDMDIPTKVGIKANFVEKYFKSGKTGQIMEGHPDLVYYDRDGTPTIPYRRILIKHK